MISNKQKIQELVEQLPDDVPIDEAIDRLYLLQKIDEGLRQAAAGDVMDHDEFFDDLLREDEETQNRLDATGSV